jgi:hypothetical protein
MSDEEIRATVTRIRSVITAMRRSMRAGAAYEANRYSANRAEMKALGAQGAELVEEALATYDVLRLVAVERGLQLPKWEGDRWHWDGLRWTKENR